MTSLAAYGLLFVAVGFGFIFVHLLAGSLIRPRKPGPEKGTIYECGEPTIGSAWIQFDLRFYVIALLFVVFDVEVVFFFPWAEVFGKANEVATLPPPPSDADEATRKQYAEELEKKSAPLRGAEPSSSGPNAAGADYYRKQARSISVLAFTEIFVFFAVLLVGFAYLWRRGDLEWVRSLSGASAGEPTGAQQVARPETQLPRAS